MQGAAYPAMSLRLPAFGSELQSVLAVKVLAPVHNIRVVDNALALADKDWRCAIWSTAGGENRVTHGRSTVESHRRIEAQRYTPLVEMVSPSDRRSFMLTLINYVLAKFQVSQLVVAGRLAVEI